SIRINKTAPRPPMPRQGVYTLVRVLYASIDPIDYKLPSMSWPVPRLVIGSSPITPGTSFVGQVQETRHPGFKAGDFVWGKHDMSVKHGTCASYTLVAGNKGVVKIPADWNPKRSLEEFAGAGVVAQTALQTLIASGLPLPLQRSSDDQVLDRTIFINGSTGGVGTFAVQMAKRCFRVKHVVVSCSGANSDFVKSLGADEVVDYRTCGANGLSGWLKDWSKTNGRSFDAVIDNVGTEPDLYWNCHHFLTADGKYVQVGGGMDVGSFAMTAKKALWPRILGGGQRAFQFLGTENKPDDLSMIGMWMAEGKVRCVIEDDNRYSLLDVKKAYEKLNSGRVRGKIIVVV
ncbi:hypothetical protein BAUCODRAFT_40833, partial [Baudoinia panamericana UAMH 10762]